MRYCAGRLLAREAVRPDGTKVVQRMVFKNSTANEFDWIWEASQDGGKTWEVMLPIDYKRKGSQRASATYCRLSGALQVAAVMATF